MRAAAAGVLVSQKAPPAEIGRLAPAERQPVAQGWHAGNATEGGGEMTLIGEAAGKCDVADTAVGVPQQLLGARHARPSRVLAQRTAEVPVKLAADLHRVPANRTGDCLQWDARGDRLLQLLADAQQPRGRNPAPCVRDSLVSDEELQRDCFDIDLREVIAREELVVQPCAQGPGAGIQDLARALEHATLFGGEVDSGELELELQAGGAQRKVDLVWLADGQEAHRAGPGGTAAATVCRPVVAAHDVDEARFAVAVASFALHGAEAQLQEWRQASGEKDRPGEFVIGTNPALAPVLKSGYMPYYGYGAGVVRLALGDNWESGGKNRSSNGELLLFLPGATLTAGKQILIRAGELTLR